MTCAEKILRLAQDIIPAGLVALQISARDVLKSSFSEVEISIVIPKSQVASISRVKLKLH